MTTATHSPFIADQLATRPIEARIVRRVIRALSANGTPVAHLHDGEERHRVANTRDILEHVFNLDECYLLTANGSWVYLIMGQEWDTICDYTINLDAAIQPVLDWINANDN